MKTALFESGFIAFIATALLSVFSQTNFPDTINPDNIRFERVSRAEGLSNATINFFFAGQQEISMDRYKSRTA